jgi:hypothetical protein
MYVKGIILQVQVSHPCPKIKIFVVRRIKFYIAALNTKYDSTLLENPGFQPNKIQSPAL